MCGRYVMVSKIKEIEKKFNVKLSKEAKSHYTPNTNISHGDYAPVVTGDRPRDLQFFQFGFTPEWAQKPMYVINARSEGDYNKEDDPQYHGSMGIIDKPMFRKVIRSQRCLVLADAFIEGPKKERLNKPYVLYLQQRRPFALAGIWDRWVNTQTGEVLSSFAVITTTANSLLQQIGHHRSPVVLDEGSEQDWLNTEASLSDVTSLLKPYPSEWMNAYPISSKIKSPSTNGLDLIEPIGERLSKEFDYHIYRDLRLEGMGMTTARSRRDQEGLQASLF